MTPDPAQCPHMLADLAFAAAPGARVLTHLSDWTGPKPLTVGTVVTVVDGEDIPLRAQVEAIDADGTVVARRVEAGPCACQLSSA